MIMKKKFCLLFIFIFTLPSLLYSCRCTGMSVAEGVKGSEIVLKGTVLSVVETSDYEDIGLEIDTIGLDNFIKQMKIYAPIYYVTVKIDSLYKGKLDIDTIKILTPVSSASCGYRHFEKGNSYIVYANQEDFFSKWKLSIKPVIYKKENHYWTNHCTRTGYWCKEEEMEILKAIKNSNSSPNPFEISN